MLTKLAVTALILALAWLFLFRKPRRRPRRHPDNRTLPHPLQLARCPGCGVWRLPDAPCECTRGKDSP